LKRGRAGKPKEGNGKEGKEAKRPSNAETTEGGSVLEGRQRAQFCKRERENTQNQSLPWPFPSLGHFFPAPETAFSVNGAPNQPPPNPTATIFFSVKPRQEARGRKPENKRSRKDTIGTSSRKKISRRKHRRTNQHALAIAFAFRFCLQ
jgi:hypothetical protein